MATWKELEELHEQEQAEQKEEEVAPQGEISRYYDIGMDPSTWGNIPKELALQAALALEPNREAQGQILGNMGPSHLQPTYNPDIDAVSVFDPQTNQSGYINEPGPSVQDAVQTAGLVGAFTPAGRMGRAASTPMQFAGTTGTAAALTEGLRQGVTSLAGADTRDQNLIPGMDISEMGMAGATQVVPDYLTGRSFMGKYGPASFHTQNYLQRMQENLQDLGSSGLQAFRGQVSEVPSEARDLKVLGNMKYSGPDIQEGFRTQNTQALDVTTGLLEGGKIVGDKPAGLLARNAARNTREQMVKDRSEAEGGLYKLAFSDETPYQTEGLVDNIDSVLGTLAPGTKLRTRLEGIRSMMGGRRGVVDELSGEFVTPPPDPRTLEQLQSVKLDLDDQIETAVRAGDNKLARSLGSIKQDTVNYLQDHSEEYAEARSIWEQMSRPINEFDESLSGTIAEMSDDEAYRLGEIVFNPRVSNAARADMEMKLDASTPGAFRELALETMRGRLGQIRDIGQAEVPNVPFQVLSSLFKNEKEREMWKLALPDKAEELDALFRGLKIQSRNRSIGSDTAFNQESRDRFGGSSINTGVDLAKELMEWLTVIPKATKYTLGSLNEATARSRQEAGVLAQRDLTPPNYTEPSRFRKQNYPLVDALIQAGSQQARSGSMEDR